MDNFILLAIISGIGIAFITGLLGCFVVWKKMAYFGESLGHSAVLGIGIGLLLGIGDNIAVLLVIITFSLIVTYLQNKEAFSNDLILAVLAHGLLSIGIILISINPDPNFNLHSFLFGDILTVSLNEIFLIFLSAIFIYLIILTNWKALLITIISKDLAKSQNINNFKIELLFTFTMALAVAISIKIIGALLITSMLIIPSSCAKQLVNNPKNMVIISIIISILSILIGILCSYYFDIPSGPAIILTSFSAFFIINLLKSKKLVD